MAAVANELYALVERTVEGLGLELVDVERLAGGLLRVTLDAPAAPRGVTIEDCERVSRQLTHLFAVENVDFGRLEVGSPGLDRPLKRARDFRRFVGAEVKLQLFEPVNGRKRWQGRLVEFGGATGAEQLAIDVMPDDQAPGTRRPGNGKRGSGGGKRRVEAPVERIRFALADVDKARLVPEVDFRRSGRS
jgi:ribosome maturation factor RimP